MIVDILLIIAGIALVLYGADRLTAGASALARRMNIPEIIIGLTIVAAGTSAPEFFVSFMSALKGTPDMAVGTLRLKAAGSNAGHNGLGHIQQILGTERYCRLRVGIGNEFERGMQIQWVLGKYNDEEMKTLEPKLETACEIIKSFVLCGVDFTMNAYNKKK